MLYAFQLERGRDDGLVTARTLKVVRPREYVRLASALHLDGLTEPVPPPASGDVYECDVDRNAVVEALAPAVDEYDLRRRLAGALDVAVPDDDYVLSYEELVAGLADLVAGAAEAYIYVLSKYARPGYLHHFAETLGRKANTTVYVAVEGARRARRRLGPGAPVALVPTRSHRKVVLALLRYEDGGWAAAAYYGSMNVFYPGVDDYMEAARDYRSLQVAAHAVIRAFLLV